MIVGVYRKLGFVGSWIRLSYITFFHLLLFSGETHSQKRLKGKGICGYPSDCMGRKRLFFEEFQLLNPALLDILCRSSSLANEKELCSSHGVISHMISRVLSLRQEAGHVWLRTFTPCASTFGGPKEEGPCHSKKEAPDPMNGEWKTQGRGLRMRRPLRSGRPLNRSKETRRFRGVGGERVTTHVKAVRWRMSIMHTWQCPN